MGNKRKNRLHIILEGAENREFLPPSFVAPEGPIWMIYFSQRVYAFPEIHSRWRIRYNGKYRRFVKQRDCTCPRPMEGVPAEGGGLVFGVSLIPR
jgi:hypothetical protein